MAINTIKDDVRQLLELLTDEEKTLFKRVLEAEKSKLHLKNPRNIMEDLERAVREAIK
jgi:Xaa-Pro aminopeptidase